MAQGPYIVAALLCDQIIEGKDGVLSAVRIIDQVTRTQLESGGYDISALTLNSTFGVNILPFTLMVILKAGDFNGSGKVRSNLVSPSGKALIESVVDVELRDDKLGANLVFRGGFEPEESGVHWFDIYFNEKLLTRSPLLIRNEMSVQKRLNSELALPQGDRQQ